MSNIQPCFRCTGENNSEYRELEGDNCPSCDGTELVTPGPVDAGDKALIAKYVYAQWWIRLRALKAQGMKRGKKKERDRLIRKQTNELFADFCRMNKLEQRSNRLTMAEAVEQFKNIDTPRQPPSSVIDEPKELQCES